MANNPMLPIPVPKSSVELIKPDDNAKFKDMVTVFEGMMKQSLANENYEYQTQLRQLSEEDRLAKLEQANYQFEKLRKRFGSEVDYFQEHNFSPDVTEKELTMKAENDLLQIFQQRQAEGNPMTLAELGQYSDQISGEAYKTLSGIIMAPGIEAAQQQMLGIINNNPWMGSDELYSIVNQMGGYVDFKWAQEQLEKTRTNAEQDRNFFKPTKGGSGNNRGNNGGNDGGGGGDSGRTPTWDAGAIPGIVAIAGITLEPGFMNDVNLSDPMLNEAEANLSSSLNKLQEASGNVAAWLKTGNGKPKFKAGYNAGELVIGDGNSRVRVKRDGTVWKVKKVEDGKITWTKVTKSEDFTTYELQIGREIAADYNDVTNWLSEYKTFHSNAEDYVRVLRNSKKRNYKNIYE